MVVNLTTFLFNALFHVSLNSSCVIVLALRDSTLELIRYMLKHTEICLEHLCAHTFARVLHQKK